MISHEGVVAVDLGKTRCRVATWSGDHRDVATGTGTPGLAAPDGVATALAAIVAGVATAPRMIGVGVAGALAAPAASAELAALLSRQYSCPAVVASDVVTAHAGALAGEPGVLLVAGTGAVGFGVDAEGVRVVDGWGPELGDFGSGAWIGREGLRAVLRERDGLGAATSLSAAVATHVPESIVAWLSGASDAARRCGTIAPVVIACAQDGDTVARDIVDRAVSLLAATAGSAARGTANVAVHGGLTGSPYFLSALTSALAGHELTVVPSRGDALDGAALLVAHTDSPHEKAVHRAH